MTAGPQPPDKPEIGPARHCPICGKTTDISVAPFCSKRCADVDLHRWLTGRYAVPDDGLGEPEAPLEEE